MEIAIILGIAAAAANMFLFWYAKKYHKQGADESANPSSENYCNANEFITTPRAAQLRNSAASELGLSVEELDRMLAKEMQRLHQERISIG